MEVEMKRVVVELTTAQRLQGIMSSLGVCEVGRWGIGTLYASWLVGTTAEGDGVVDWGKSRVQRVVNSLDCLRYSHSVGMPRQRRVASRRGCCSRVVGDGVVDFVRRVVSLRIRVSGP
jgi:hypothetical protein